MGCVIHRAWQNGSRYDAWSEHFNFDKWQDAFRECGVDPWFYTYRERSLDEILPWSHIDTGVSIDFLQREYECAGLEKETLHCSGNICNRCGLQRTEAVCRTRYSEQAAMAEGSGHPADGDRDT